VRPDFSQVGAILKADVRGRCIDLEVVALPMLPQRYYRTD
jgi:hypothetical protein